MGALMLFNSSCKKAIEDLIPTDPNACTVTVVEVGNSIDVPTTWDKCHTYHCANFVNVYAALTMKQVQ